MGKLTTHILDVASGKPAAGVVIELYRYTPAREWLATAVSNADGRCESPLLEGQALVTAEYELVFRIGDYFRGIGTRLTEPPFLDSIPVRFSVADPQASYHIPLLVSPWSYSTYRGS